MVDLREAHSHRAALVDKKLAATLPEVEQEKPREIPWAGLFHDPDMIPAERMDEELAKSWARCEPNQVPAES
jgi:hypothetical protein